MLLKSTLRTHSILESEFVAELNLTCKTTTANYDIYIPFVERGLQLINAGGHLTYILPHKFFTTKYGEKLRHLITEGKLTLSEIINFGDNQVFGEANLIHVFLP